MEMEKLMSSPDRVRILDHILLHRTMTNKEVTLGSGACKGLVSIYLNLLVDQQILRKEGRSYKVNDTAMVRALKKFMNLTKLSVDDLDISWARGIGLYGSWADGTNTNESDVDIWILVESIDNEKNALFRKALSDRTRSEVNILILTDDKIRSMEEQDTLFFRNIKYGSVVLAGENLD
jgi:predicted nucleotidyltransferase